MNIYNKMVSQSKMTKDKRFGGYGDHPTAYATGNKFYSMPGLRDIEIGSDESVVSAKKALVKKKRTPSQNW